MRENEQEKKEKMRNDVHKSKAKNRWEKQKRDIKANLLLKALNGTTLVKKRRNISCRNSKKGNNGAQIKTHRCIPDECQCPKTQTSNTPLKWVIR